jgi:group I intron endonuclease
MTGIYKIQSILFPDKIYIGSALCFHLRRKSHINYLKRGNHINPILQNHINKYGINDFEFSILEECVKEKLIEREQYYIDNIKPSFNICKIAGSRLGLEGGMKGKHHSDKTKNKMSFAHKGNVPKNKGIKGVSKETSKKISLAGLGRYHSPESRLKTSEKLKGHPVLKETRDKISKGHKGKCLSLEQKRKIGISNIGKHYIGRVVNHLQFIKDNINNNTQLEIARQLNVSQSAISRIIKRYKLNNKVA